MRKFIISMLLIFSMFPQIAVFAENDTVDVWVNMNSTVTYSSDEETRVISALLGTQTDMDKPKVNPIYRIYNLDNIAADLYLIQMVIPYNFLEKDYYSKYWYLAYISESVNGMELEVVDEIHTTNKNNYQYPNPFKNNTEVYNNISGTGISTDKYPILVYDREWKSKYENGVNTIYGTANESAVYGISKKGFVKQTFKEVDDYYTGCKYETVQMSDAEISNINKFNYLSNGNYIVIAPFNIASYNTGAIMDIYNDADSLIETYRIGLDNIDFFNVGKYKAAVRVINDNLIEAFHIFYPDDPYNKSPFRWGYIAKVACIDVSRSSGTGNGMKNIPVVDGADTVPFNSSLNFNDTDIPLAYKIKDGVIGENHFNTEVTENINNAVIAANNIVIPTIVFVKKSGKKTVTYDVGQDFDKKITQTDKSMGADITVEMSKDGKFSYTCITPQNLTAGSYNKEYKFDQKTVYVRVEIVEQPTSSGSVTVNF